MREGAARAAIDTLLAAALADHRSGRLAEAAAGYQAVLAQSPEHVDALHLLGQIARDQGLLDAASHLIGRAVERDPSFAEAQNSLGTVVKAKGDLVRAIGCFQTAVRLQPNYGVALNNLGNAWMDLGDRPTAAAAIGRALVLDPTYAEAHGNLGNALQLQGEVDEAQPCYRRALALTPGSATSWSNLASLDQALAEAESAERRFRRALAIKPEPWLHSNLLFAMSYDPAVTSERLFAEYRRWEQRHGRPCYGRIRAYANPRQPDRRLRLGYVSADFRAHPVGWNVLGLIERHDRERFQVFCYGDVLRPDRITERFAQRAEVWRGVTGVGDEALAERIRADGIDVLVILAGHTGRNRLRAAAFKPAPVQVSFHDLSTSGLEVMDAWLTDPSLHPADTHERFTEKLIRLPCFYLHQAPEDAPEPGPAPETRNGFITFGSCNNTAKLNREVLALWSDVLRAVPGSRLLFKYLNRFAAPGLRRRIGETMARLGIAASRLEFLPGELGRGEQLAVLTGVDIALDPFPFSGSTATFEALWMGVPVVSLAGERFLGRVGGSVLAQVGLSDLVGADRAAYVRIAAALAGDRGRRMELRQELRGRLAVSPLCEADAYARSVEVAYRTLWQTWCRG
ncbi:MAG: tetratricopeptide repeat protein [Proteobacteria bacterium]|nr:tetratricopeptide repeat protein [Pseudomonadota bacterium]MBI3498787.1 tetratricopeptide repeat protein [Pseudomonadota bacterium]